MPINQYYARFNEPKKTIASIENFKKEVKAQLRVEAHQYQQEVANVIQNEIKRKRDSTGRLVSVALDSRNAIYGEATWRVPNTKFLDQSAAKYWRTIEQGSAAVWKHSFIGTLVYFRGDIPGRPFRTIASSKNIGPYTAGGLFRSKGHVRKVTKEIDPMNAYRIAFNEGEWASRIRRDFTTMAGRNFRP